jgi:2-haloacid dehalogenase
MSLAAHLHALTFDVFGTVVDWRTSIIRAGEALSARTGVQVDWPALALAWRAGYQPAMQQVRGGAQPWTPLDRLHRAILDELAPRFGLTQLDEAELIELNRVWHRLEPWPDAVAGLERLRRRYLVATLSNGNLALLTHMAKRANLRWDVILSAELARHYKPDPRVYQSAATLLDLRPDQMLMVAAHPDDLRAARAVGMHTAYVHRPLEFGPRADGSGQGVDLPAQGEFDLIATDFLDLAAQLGA